MNELREFFGGLFSTSDWPPRWQCGYWSDFHGWLYILSELMIWTAYFLIPVIILNYLNKKKQTLKFNKAYVYFAAFILLCGTTHFLDALMFWIPMYRVNALVRLATGIVSLVTVYYLIKILPQVFSQRTSIELEEEIKKRTEAENLLRKANQGLESFAYIASHDLQEPLRKIRIYSSALVEKNQHTFNEQSRELAHKIINSSQRMQAMISDVLTLVANLSYLSQLFLNLISNALKFSERDPRITITGRQAGEMAVIEFADNGIGIAEDDQHKISRPFTGFTPGVNMKVPALGFLYAGRSLKPFAAR